MEAHLINLTIMKLGSSASSSVTTPPPFSIADRTFGQRASPRRRKVNPGKSVRVADSSSGWTGSCEPLPSASTGQTTGHVVFRRNGCRTANSFAGTGAKECARLNDDMTLSFSLPDSTPSLLRFAPFGRAGGRVGVEGGDPVACDFEGLRTNFPQSSSNPRGLRRHCHSCRVTAGTGLFTTAISSSSPSIWRLFMTVKLPLGTTGFDGFG